MQQQDEPLEQLLMQRSFEPPTTNLAELIIISARPLKVVHTPAPSFFEGLRELLLPQPAFAMALALLIGFAGGWKLPVSEETQLQTQDMATNFLYSDEEWL